ncbi:phytoene/squalene synthase family protein [Athalassotoga saccharophila]|uniref:phytoene/squalene synthase family protein n=1 Tax=Athalassotoga saccharophila TaxID=1441386 RepID=UPI00137B40A3|nr:phytoene/squalene synthase family protein [Athalassotoga saccharophila]BBJ28645.1 15-cis-phytoene synthase [Athalassotoga saccharophila]
MSNDVDLQRQIFKSGSKTFFNSSLFFPDEVRKDVFRLYAFVRIADDYVDAIPQKVKEFNDFVRTYRESFKVGHSEDKIINDFIQLSFEKKFNPDWIEAFFKSMEMDIFKKKYSTISETLDYIYGSAEVIGLFMARIMDLDEDSFYYAKMLGRAFQYINFVRDIDEDKKLGRRYLPIENFDERVYEDPFADELAFEEFILLNVKRYEAWDDIARKGFGYIPVRYRIPIMAAADMYRWTAKKIRSDPFIVLKKKVKPSKFRIISRVGFRVVLPK